MKILILGLLITMSVLIANAQYYGNYNVNVQGNVDVYHNEDPRKLELERQKLELERKRVEQELAMKRRQEVDNWEMEMKDRDQVLQEQALASNDGKCADHFCGKRCQKRASNNGFCATHYREMRKGLKEDKYKSASRTRLLNIQKGR